MENDDRGIYETRGFACEIVAWRFLSHLSEHELIDYLLGELPPIVPPSDSSSGIETLLPPRSPLADTGTSLVGSATERTRLLFDERTMPVRVPKIIEQPQSETWGSRMSGSTDNDPTLAFVGLNALEIATIAGAKRFLSQRVVQNVVNGIWSGDIIFWDSLSTHTRKKAQIYHQR